CREPLPLCAPAPAVGRAPRGRGAASARRTDPLADPCGTAGRPVLAADRGGGRTRAARRAPLHGVAPPCPAPSLPVPPHARACPQRARARRPPRPLNQAHVPAQRGLLRGPWGLPGCLRRPWAC